MNTPSEEQQQVINDLENNKNVVVDACAGSGKSTTVLSCASQMKYNFVQLTYNKHLQYEIQQKIKELDLKNISVYTYHGLAVKYYDSDCHNDINIRRILRENIPSRTPIGSFDVLVIDECQDMTLVYFQLLWKFCIEMGGKMSILVLGDERQALYGFKGADHRFLTMAEQCWETFPNLKTNLFERRKLLTSYRITNSMCKFVNECMLENGNMISKKAGSRVYYSRKKFKFIQKNISYHIKNIYNTERDINYSDFLILCKSLKKPICKKIENELVLNGIPVYMPNTDSREDIDLRVTNNKVVFSTFCASKGRQRKYVFVLDFDDSYYFAMKNPDFDNCPNDLYVACTRGSSKLFLYEKSTHMSKRLPFLKWSHQHMMQNARDIEFSGTPTTNKNTDSDSDSELKEKRIIPWAVTDMIKFLSEQCLDKLVPTVEKVFETIIQPNEPIVISSITETTDENFEDISDINGNVIPIMFFDEIKRIKGEVIIPVLQEKIRKVCIEEIDNDYVKDAVLHLKNECVTISDYLYNETLRSAVEGFSYSRFSQIPKDKFNWIEEEIMQKCFDNFNSCLEDEIEECLVEHVLASENDTELQRYIEKMIFERFGHLINRSFTARIDLRTRDSMIEMKFTSELSIDHKLQLMIYALFYYLKQELKGLEVKKTFYLINIKTCEKLKLNATIEELKYVFLEIIHNKHFSEDLEMNDNQFIDQIQTSLSSFSSHL